MKILIIGFDGGTEKIFRNFNMPFMHSLLDNNGAPLLEEDLLNRGWYEILSGAHAAECGAFYRRVLCNGTMEWGNYKFDDMLNNESIVPIWKIAEQNGDRVGMMNIPTTFPAQKVDGFFISSTGAGLFKVKGIPEEFCWPREIAAELKKMDYRVDIRLTKGVRFKNADDFVNQLVVMFEKRVSAYINLASEYKIDFGFMACRCTNVLQYALMYELERYFRNKELNKKCTIGKESKWDDLLENFYEKLDTNLKRLANELSPDHIILVSDHSNAPYFYKADVNYFLRQSGFQKGLFNVKGSINNLGKIFLQPGFRKSVGLTKNLINQKVDPGKSKAFGVPYINGIFINDRERFGGPVESKNVRALACQIVMSFNKSPEAMQHNMSAELYREDFTHMKWQKHMPDIRIKYPDTMFFSADACSFIRPNENFGPVEDISKLVPMLTGVKGRYPLFRIDHELGSLIKKDDPHDLRIVHKIVDRYYKNSE